MDSKETWQGGLFFKHTVSTVELPMVRLKGNVPYRNEDRTYLPFTLDPVDYPALPRHTENRVAASVA
jgi:hypothetical protein